MQPRAHLKLIVSERAHVPADDSMQDRMSMVQPLSSMRLRRQWLKAHASVLALWCLSVALLFAAGSLLLARL